MEQRKAKPATSGGPLWALAALAAALFALLAGYQRHLAGEAVRGARLLEREAALEQEGKIAEVTRAVSAMKLVSMEIQTKVSLDVVDESWRGDVRVRVEAPARLLYGVDLSNMSVSRVSLSQVGGCVVRIPPAERLASEVLAEQERVDVQVGWLRLRSRAGEYLLGQTRRLLSLRAREMRLTEDDARRVSLETRERVAQVVRRILGEDANVVVVEDEALSHAGAGLGAGVGGVP